MMNATYLICIATEGYGASLTPRKVYARLPDQEAEGEGEGLVRVVDDTGEDYLYPAELFVPLELPAEAEEAFRHQPARV